MKGRYSKKWWRALTKNERRHLVGLMTAHGGGMGGYLPDDCSECQYCGQPKLGYPGLCKSCYNDYDAMHKKADAALGAVSHVATDAAIRPASGEGDTAL